MAFLLHLAQDSEFYSEQLSVRGHTSCPNQAHQNGERRDRQAEIFSLLLKHVAGFRKSENAEQGGDDREIKAVRGGISGAKIPQVADVGLVLIQKGRLRGGGLRSHLVIS